jgi:LytS/YehU family sensor histidine kinase
MAQVKSQETKQRRQNLEKSEYTILHISFKKHYLSNELPTMSLEAFFTISVALPVAFSIIEFIPNLYT